MRSKKNPKQYASGNFIAQAAENASASINVIGFTPEILHQLGLKIVEERVDEARSKQLKKLSARLKVSRRALEGFFRTLSMADVPIGELVPTLETIAKQYRDMLHRLEEIRPVDEPTESLVIAARKDLENATNEQDYRRLDQLLETIESLEFSSLERAEQRLGEVGEEYNRRIISVIESRISRANLSMTQLRYAEAVEHLVIAQSRVPRGFEALRLNLQFMEAEVRYAEGRNKKVSAPLRNAISLYRAILNALSRESASLEWAIVQSALGTALIKLSERDGSGDFLKEAVESLSLAIGEASLNRLPKLLANASNSLGIALALMGARGSSPENLSAAIATHKSALRVRVRSTSPEDWGQTQHNLGSALFSLGMRESTGASLIAAIDATRLALTERTLERNQGRWIGSQNNLGNALAELGRRTGREDHLYEAVGAYERALTVLGPDDESLQYAQILNNLGVAFGFLAYRSDDSSFTEKAISTYEKALTVRVRSESPLLWAETQSNLGTALADLAERRKNVDLFKKATTAFQSALSERTKLRMPLEWGKTRYNMGSALVGLGVASKTPKEILTGLRLLSSTLAVRNQHSVPLEWAETLQTIANGFLHLSLLTKDHGALLQALVLCRSSFLVQSEETVPVQWAMTHLTYGRTLWELGRSEQKLILPNEAKSSLLAARRAFHAAGIFRFDQYVNFPVQEIERRLRDLNCY
jgi:tetratricopeptide (TPR) repeat protein